MLDIKPYRGESKATGKWVYGYYVVHELSIGTKPRKRHLILSGEGFSDYEAVIPSTVGKYTGLCDRNNEVLYQGDKVNIPYITPMGDITSETDCTAKIDFEFGRFVLLTDPVSTPITNWCKRGKGDYIPNFGNPDILSQVTYLELVK